MNFGKFGSVGYVSETKIVGFVDNLEKGEIRAARCKKCGTTYFPPRADCKICLTSDVAWVSLSGECELITYSRIEHPPTAFKNQAPYVLAVGRLKEGVSVFAPISKNVREEELKPGLRMVLVPVKTGERVFYELRPAA